MIFWYLESVFLRVYLSIVYYVCVKKVFEVRDKVFKRNINGIMFEIYIGIVGYNVIFNS